MSNHALFFSVEEGFPTIKGDLRALNFLSQYKDVYKKHLVQPVELAERVLHKNMVEIKTFTSEIILLFQELSIAAQRTDLHSQLL